MSKQRANIATVSEERKKPSVDIVRRVNSLTNDKVVGVKVTTNISESANSSTNIRDLTSIYPKKVNNTL